MHRRLFCKHVMTSKDNSSTAPQRLIDCCCILISYRVALLLATWLSSKGLFVFPSERQWRVEYSTLLLLAILCWAVASTYTQLYTSHRVERLEFAAGKLLQTLVLWAIMTTGGLFVLKLHDVSRQFTLYVIVGSGVLVFLRQLTEIIIRRRMHRFGYSWRTALVIGEQTCCARVAQLLVDAYPMGYRVVAVPLDGANQQESALIAENLPEAEEAFIIPGIPQSEHLALQLLKEGKSVHIIPELLDARFFHQALGDIAGIPVISLRSGTVSVTQAIAKRLADCLGAIIFLILLSPIAAVIVCLLKVTSQGPVLFGQTRVGKLGKLFTMYKFRTMVPDAEAILRNRPELYARYVANNYKLPQDEDPRITPIGRVLRSTSLDELPQLLNVLNGNMSLVGPRPVVPAEVDNYGDYAALFLSAKPGMTGHWQVSGRSEVAEYSKRVELDLEYIRDRSLAKDFEILVRTVPCVLRRRGAH
jgi:exopolysaccharide production protein ExoY